MLYARFNLSVSVLLLTALCACARDEEARNPGDTPPEEASPAVPLPDRVGLVAVMQVNNEIGTVQPIAELAAPVVE